MELHIKSYTIQKLCVFAGEIGTVATWPELDTQSSVHVKSLWKPFMNKVPVTNGVARELTQVEGRLLERWSDRMPIMVDSF